MICHILHLEEDVKASTSQILDVGATAKDASTQFFRLDEDHDHTRKIIDCLLEDVTTARAEVKEIIDMHADME